MKKLLSLSLLFAFFLNQANADLIEIEPNLGGSSGPYVSEAWGVSGDGSVIVGYGQGASDDSAFRYSGGTFTDIGALLGGSGWSYVTAVSSNGLVSVGSFATVSGSNAFKYTSSGGVVDLGTMGSGDYFWASDVSSDGSVIVGEGKLTTGGNSVAFKYDDFHGMQSLGFLTGGDTSSATAVSSDGLTIVGYANSSVGSGFHAFKYTDALGMTDLGAFGGTNAFAKDVSNDGSVIVGYINTLSGVDHAFKYVDGSGVTDLGTFGGSTTASAVSGDGSIVVGSSVVSSGVTRAFKHTDADGMVDLGTLGGNSSNAVAISNDGKVIVGTAQTSDGKYHAFMYNNAVSDPSSGSSGSSSGLVDINNTYAALYENGRSLNSILNLKTAITSSLLNQDCNKFGANGFCVGVGYRYTSVNHQYMSQQASNLRIGYRFTPNFRAGLIFDQTLDSDDPNNFTTQNKTPMSGFFLNFSEREDGSGFGARVSALYARSTADIKRSTFENTEAGTGSAKIKTSGMLAEVSYGKKLSESLMLKPFTSLRKTDISRSGYSEVQGASFPISYNALRQNLTVATLGLRSLLKLNSATALTFEVATERKIQGKIDGYSGNISFLGDFSLAAPSLRTQTNYFDVGLYRDLANNQRISANFRYGNQNLNSAKVGMMYVGYYFGF